jgi:nitrate reductase delta subunit
MSGRWSSSAETHYEALGAVPEPAADPQRGSFVSGLLGLRKRSKPTLPASELKTAWAAVSALLDYPSQGQLDALPAIEAAAAGLSEGIRTPLLRLTAFLAGRPLPELQADYVATFDHTRKCALHLTYYAFGDTRKRGVALVRFKQAYRGAGLEITDEELPDHLCVVCAFGATGDADVAWKLLTEHRAGLEMLRLALTDKGSPWLDGVLTLLATLPPLDGDTEAAVQRLLSEGPPGEEVGMDAYALDPQLNPHPAADADLLEGVRP